jgi:hypothetical protein
MKTSNVFQRGFLLLTLAVVLLTASTACSSNEGDSDRASESAATTSGASAAAPIVGSDASGASSNESASGGTTGEAAQSAPGLDRLVVRTAQMDLAVADVAGTINAVRDQAVSNGGFVFSSSTQMRNDRQFAQMTIRVPADRYDATMDALRSASWVDKVQREESSTKDVSAEYVDNQAQLASLRTTQTRFMALLDKAETVDDILRLENELTSVRTQIEQIQGRQNYLDNATSYSTISVSLSPVGVPMKSADTALSVSNVFERAWDHSRGAIEAALVATITLTIFAAFLLPVAGVVYLGWRLARSRVRVGS